MNLRAFCPGLLASFAFASVLPAQGTRLLRHPTVSRELLAFQYAGDLWVVSRTGGQARRLTATPGVETDPRFSPDGTRIAFSATIAGNTDVYVVPAAGGDATRLTYHPGPDRVRGWTPNGKSIVFGSPRQSAPQHSYFRLFTVAADGGLAEPLPMPRAFTGVLSPDGRRVAYEEISTTFTAQWYEVSGWRHYRGGRTHPIRVMNLADYSVEKLPWKDSNDTEPMWIGNTVYFLSDRNFTVNLFSYAVDTKQLKQLTQHDDFDIMNASAGPDAIVYEQAGYVHLFDLKSGQSRRLNIEVTGDLPWARAQFKRVAGMIRNASLSPTGVRAAFEARGEIFTVPAEKGDYRNVTKSAAIHDRDPVWSPDGMQLAWLSDASGEYQLMLGEPTGVVKPKAVPLPSASFFSELAWSPDGKQLSFLDSHLNLWSLEVATGRTTKLDTETYDDPSREMDPVWSPDSKWIAYSKNLDNHLRAIFVYSFADAKAYQITDGMSDVISPAFDAGGKYLYFLASTDYGPRTGWLEMSSVDRPVRRSIYLVVLPAKEPSPLLPELGDEPGPAPQSRAKPDSTVRIDFAGIGQRILSLGVPSADYANLTTGLAGTIFYTEPMSSPGGPATLRLQRYQLKERTAAPFLEGIRSYTLSGDRKKLLYSAPGADGGRWGVLPADRAGKVGDGPVNVAQLEMWVDPRAEWAQIFRETWRIQREFFYDATMHGVDWRAVYEKYAPLLPYVGHRSDLGYLIATIGGELVVGHSYLIGAGDEPAETPVSVGMLGADFSLENGGYRIRRIYSGENWNPELRAPLSAPGIQVAEGDYLLEVNGVSLAAPMNLYRAFEGTAGRQTIIRVNHTPSVEGSRLLTVVPVASEEALRSRAWVERNRRTVDSLSRGRLAYVWLPNTAGGGYTYFTRYFFAQQQKDGAIVDERYNQGGQIADYLVNEIDRKLMGYFATRDGKVSTSPTAGIFGPKVMIVNESAGSGGDALPYMFKQRKLGPVVGTRTWGGLVGTIGVPTTLDGGGITAPDLAFYDLEGRWAVENEGVTPDIEVEFTAAEVIKGHDPQLERAVQEALKLLEQNPVRRVSRPSPIDRASRKKP
ncbi:MAG TPA: PDZ domain-containing protein [Gemmatimonadales bacterium]|nr:PDZ domain-containing protein [Gemmatimonadales bacterium]